MNQSRMLYTCFLSALCLSLLRCAASTSGAVDWSVLEARASPTELFGQPFTVFSSDLATKFPGILNASFWKPTPLKSVSYRVFILDRWWTGRNSSSSLCKFFPHCVRVPMVRAKTLFADSPKLLKDFQDAGIIAPNVVQVKAGSSSRISTGGALMRSSATAIRDSVKQLATRGRALAAKVADKDAAQRSAALPPVAPLGAAALKASAVGLRDRSPPSRRTSSVSIGRVITHLALLRLYKTGKLPGGPMAKGEAMIVLEEDTAAGMSNSAAVLEKAITEQPAGWDMTVLYGGLKACRAASPANTTQLGFVVKQTDASVKRNLTSVDPYATSVVPINTRLLSAVALAYSGSAADKIFRHLPANASLEYWLSYMLPGPASVKRKPPALDAYALCNFRVFRPSVKQLHRAINEIGNNDAGVGKKIKQVVKKYSSKMQASTEDTKSWWSSLLGRAQKEVKPSESKAKAGKAGDGKAPK